MNGRIARSTFPPPRMFRPRNLRTVLLCVCCAGSLALLGAVRLAPQFRPEPLLAVSQSPLAEWDDDAAMLAESAEVTLGALNLPPDEPTLVGAGLPEDAVPLPMEAPAAPVPVAPAPVAPVPVAPAPVAPAPAAAAPSLRLPPATPTLVRPRTQRMLMEVTAYCPCSRCCGPRAQGITASGKRVSYNGGKFVAADTRLLKFNTKLLIPGYANGQPVEVIDRGGAIKGHKLDVYFPSHQEARVWGRQKLWVTVVE